VGTRVPAHRRHRRDAGARRAFIGTARGRRSSGRKGRHRSAVRDRRRSGGSDGRRRRSIRYGSGNRAVLRDERRRRGCGCRVGEGRRSRPREGIARREDGSRRRTPEGGAWLMLYHLLYPFHTQLSVLNVTRYITFRTAASTLSALAISLVFGP